MKRTTHLAACLLVMLCSFPLFTTAQDAGIKFEHGLSWKEIKEKAKRENKFIFMDCFTTWCGPCKLMSQNIFTLKEVGDMFNDKFISVKVQLDKTPKDNEEVKRFYEDAAAIANEFNVQAYPTFLYFTPDGKLVHLFVGFTKEVKKFMDEAAKAFDPSTRYFTRMEQAIKEAGTNPAGLKALALEAMEKRDGVNMAALCDAYIKSQKELYTKDNLEFLDKMVQSSRDSFFYIYMEQPKKIDAIMGKGYFQKRITQLILAGEGGFDWLNSKLEDDLETVRKNITQKYPAIADLLMARLNIYHLEYSKKGDEFLKVVPAFVKKYNKQVFPEELASYARFAVSFSQDPAVRKQALKWVKKASAESRDPSILSVYATLLYKSGKKQEGISKIKKVIALVEKDVQNEFMLKFAQSLLDKMEKGEDI